MYWHMRLSAAGAHFGIGGVKRKSANQTRRGAKGLLGGTDKLFRGGTTNARARFGSRTWTWRDGVCRIGAGIWRLRHNRWRPSAYFYLSAG